MSRGRTRRSGSLEVVEKPGTDEHRAVDALAGQIARHRELYYNRAPEISDAEFDALEDRLRELDPTHPLLARIGSTPEEGLSEQELVDDAEVRDGAQLRPP
ncbi:MAG: hypothetical protein HC923_09575, partial [Myxococcales bacterium]|nr:hypothetical protein [Myxococcales bacterium]